MAESESFRGDSPYIARHSVIRASQVAVALLRANYDGRADTQKPTVGALVELDQEGLFHLIAVQNLWLLDQMSYIEHLEGYEVEDQIIRIGLNVAEQEAGLD